MTPHQCTFDEVEIEESDQDESGLLVTGMKILVPCECGEEPMAHLEFMEGRMQEMQAALLSAEPDRPLYHWAPAARRKQIERYGLRPAMRSTTTADGVAPYVCFADSPSWAWALSGGMAWTPRGTWDLWQTWLDRVEPVLLASPDRPSGIYEIRVEHRVFKRDLWYSGSREKP